jgi:hypothetical protein
MFPKPPGLDNAYGGVFLYVSLYADSGPPKNPKKIPFTAGTGTCPLVPAGKTRMSAFGFYPAFFVP